MGERVPGVWWQDKVYSLVGRGPYFKILLQKNVVFSPLYVHNTRFRILLPIYHLSSLVYV